MSYNSYIILNDFASTNMPSAYSGENAFDYSNGILEIEGRIRKN